jgi:Electron transfer DM13
MAMDVREPTRPERRARAARTPPRWVEALPTGVLVVAALVKLIVSPNAVRDALTNVRPLLLTVAVGIGWLLLWLVLLPRLVRSGWVRTGILTLVALALAAAIVLPSVRNTTVVETFPGGARSPATSAPADDASPTTAPEPTTPVRLGAGPLTGIGHDATGTVVLYEQPDGAFVVGLEEIDVEPGPDYFVDLVPGPGRSDPGNDGIELDRLRGNQGTQFYVVPPGVTPTPGEWTVLIWCKAFAVPIASATPA